MFKEAAGDLHSVHSVLWLHRGNFVDVKLVKVPSLAALQVQEVCKP